MVYHLFPGLITKRVPLDPRHPYCPSPTLGSYPSYLSLPASPSGAAGCLLRVQNSNLYSLPAGKPGKAEAWVVLRASKPSFPLALLLDSIGPTWIIPSIYFRSTD